VLSQVLLVALFLKQKFERFRESLAGHLKLAGEQQAGRVLSNTGLQCLRTVLSPSVVFVFRLTITVWNSVYEPCCRSL